MQHALAGRCCLFALLLSASFAHADTWTVTSNGNSGGCTPNSTSDIDCTLDIAIAAASSDDTIVFSPAVQTQTISIGPLVIGKNLTIDGSPNGVVLDANSQGYHFYIGIEVTARLSHLAFQNGFGSGSGGSLYVESTASVTIDSCTFAHNGSGGSGGAVNNNGSLNIMNSTFTANGALTGGGAIYSAGVFTISNSTVVGNTTAGPGGGIATSISGGGYLMSSIVANNSSSAAPDLHATTASLGGNLIGNITGGSLLGADASDQVGDSMNPIDPRLSPAGLANNGGATQTLALLADSPAIHKGACAGHASDPTIPAATFDQRDVLRGALCDIGAFDATLIFYSGFEN